MFINTKDLILKGPRITSFLKCKIICLFFGCAGCTVLQGLFSICSEWGLLSSCMDFSLRWPLSRAHGLQELWLLGSRAQAQELWPRGFSCSSACGIFQDQDQTAVLCQGPAPVDPGTSKGGRRWRGKTCLFINVRLD